MKKRMTRMLGLLLALMMVLAVFSPLPLAAPAETYEEPAEVLYQEDEDDDVTLPAGHFWIDVTGGTANRAYAAPGDIVTVALDPTQVPAGQRFMIWQIGRIIEVPVPAGWGGGFQARFDGFANQVAGLNLSAAVSPFVNGTTLSSPVIQFIMPAETRTLPGGAGTINNFPQDTLWISALYDTVAVPGTPTYRIWSTSQWLWEETGVRLRGTPNEERTAAGLAEQFIEMGFPAENVVHHRHRFMNSANVDSGTGPSAGRVIFTDASRHGDMLGNANPNNATFGTVTGTLVDLGTWTAADGIDGLNLPAANSGNIVGAVRFEPVAAAANLNAIRTAVDAIEGTTLTGFIFTRSGGSYTNQQQVPAALGLTGSFPNISMPLANFNRVLRDRADFESMQWHNGGATQYTNTTVARLPAATDDPDLIIVLTAHMDTVLAATGASDNGSGVSVVMALAEYFLDVDLGNIEVWFAPNGSEEGNSMSGARFIVHRLLTPEQRARTININFDMVGSPSWFSDTAWGRPGSPLDAFTLDPDPQWRNHNAGRAGFPQSLSLPTFLVSQGAGDGVNFDWAPGINNVRINHVGGVDGARFAEMGIDTVNILRVTDFDDALEFEYHRGGDNFYDNLTYDGMVMAFNLAKYGILRAAEYSVTKRADFELDHAAARITLTEADRLFRTFDRIEALVDGQLITFRYDDAEPGTQTIPDTVTTPENITRVLGWGVGIADHRCPVRNVGLGLAPVATATGQGLAGVQLPRNTLLTRLDPGTETVVNGASITPSTAALRRNQSLQLQANFVPASASNQNVTWISSNPNLATVDAYGRVTAHVATGTVVITMITEDGGFRSSATIRLTM